MIVSISQPAYLPWLGYFDRIKSSQLHVILDHVQLEKRSFTSRNKILTANGPLWLSVPVRTKGLYQRGTIDIIEIENDSDWRSNHWKNIKQAYGKTPYFKEISPRIEAIYLQQWTLLNELCQKSTAIFLELLGIDTEIKRSLELKSRTTKDALILDLSKECGATTYISGPFGRDYLKKEAFDQCNIDVLFHDYQHPTYNQTQIRGTSPEFFEPYMCILDLLFNHGPESAAILSSTNSLNDNWTPSS